MGKRREKSRLVTNKAAKKQRAKLPVSLFLPGEMRAALIGRCSRRHRCGVLGLGRRWLFSRSCPGSWLDCGGAADPNVGRANV
jgi:hypothetical protein